MSRLDKSCQHCHGPMPAGKRQDALYCSERCRVREHLGYPPFTAINGFAGERRKTRDGTGLKLYLLPDDLEELSEYAEHFSPRLKRKLRGAIDRIERKRDIA